MSALQSQSEIRDVVVIGSGAGGATAAHVLTNLGIRVTLLEAGPMLTRTRNSKNTIGPIATTTEEQKTAVVAISVQENRSGSSRRRAVAGNSTENLIPLQMTRRIFGGFGHGL